MTHSTVRRAIIDDLPQIVAFILEEAREAEGRPLDRGTVEIGIRTALEDDTIARYWLLIDDDGNPAGCTSVVREWSDWHAGFYWWIQSMYIAPAARGRGHLTTLLDAVRHAAREDDCLDLRLYVHEGNAAAVRAYEKAEFAPSPYRILTRTP